MRISSSRWIAIVGLTIGVFFLLFRFSVDDRSLFRAFLEGASASFAAMVVGGVAQRFWGGAQVAEASGGPSGLGLRFIQVTRRPLRLLVERLDEQLETVNRRLATVEEDVEILKRALRPAD